MAVGWGGGVISCVGERVVVVVGVWGIRGGAVDRIPRPRARLCSLRNYLFQAAELL